LLIDACGGGRAAEEGASEIAAPKLSLQVGVDTANEPTGLPVVTDDAAADIAARRQVETFIGRTANARHRIGDQECAGITIEAIAEIGADISSVPAESRHERRFALGVEMVVQAAAIYSLLVSGVESDTPNGSRRRAEVT
jgi:hypothetical protein